MDSDKESHNIVSKLKNSLYIPYILLLFAALSLFYLLSLSSDNLNKLSNQSKEHLLNSVMDNELKSLSNQVKDYSFWYDAVKKLIITYDSKWVESNLQETLNESFSISRVLVLHVDYSVITSIHNAEIELHPLRDALSAEMIHLYNRALETNMLEPEPITGFVWIGEQIHLVAVSPLTPDIDSNGLLQDKAYGLMVFTRILDKELLDSWSEDYQFKDIQLRTQPDEIDENYIAVNINSPLNRWLASVVLKKDTPGDDFIESAFPWMFGFVIMVLLVSVFASFRVRRFAFLVRQTLNDLHLSQEQLLVSKKQLQNVIEGAHLGYWDWNYQTGEQYVNDNWLQILGLERSDIKNNISDWEERIHPDDKERMINTVEAHILSGTSYSEDFRMQHKDGHWVWIQGSGAVVEYLPGGQARRLCGTHQNVEKRKEYELWLRNKATHDYLTGLYNRLEMETVFDKELDRAHRHHHELSVFMIDLDHFKNINDQYGHQSGDLVLRNFADFLIDMVRNIDVVARYGGEEFIVIVPETAKKDALELADRLRDSVEKLSFTVNTKSIHLTVSIGVASFPDNGSSREGLIEKADKAVYRAKNSGRNCVMHVDSINFKS